MVALPGLRAVTTPLLKVATSLSDEVHVTFLLSTFSGKNCVFTSSVSPGVSVVAVGSMVNLLNVTFSLSSSLHEVSVATAVMVMTMSSILITFFIIFF